MDYSKLTPLLVEAVKALKGQVEIQNAAHGQAVKALKEKLDQKDNEIGQLQERLLRLEMREAVHKR